MRGFDRPLAAVLVLGALLCACAQQAPSPTPPPTMTPPPEEYPKVTYVTLLFYPFQKTCAVVAIPYHAYVKKVQGAEIVWDIVDDACPVDVDKVAIKFDESGIVEDIQDDERQAAKNPAMKKHKQKKGKVKGAADKLPHHYTVTVPGFEHDPEIEIWP